MGTTIILAESTRRLTVDEMRNLHCLDVDCAREKGFNILYHEPMKDGNVARRRIFAYAGLLCHEKVLKKYFLPKEFIDVFGTRKYTKDEVRFFNHTRANDAYICVMEIKSNGKYYYCWRLKPDDSGNDIHNIVVKDILMPQEDTSELREGTPHQVSITRYERNQEARKKCLQNYGYTCQVCGINFEQVYGEIGKDFIEVHHLNPVSNVGGEYTPDPIKDMIPLCSNCHSMIHRGGKNGMPMSLDELKNLYNAHKKK